MPQVTKQSQRQVATPSPIPGDILNTLLVVKDAVNTALLNEHTRFADLSNILSEVESQVREAFDSTIKALKSEIEKRKRKVVPGIKKLQELLKSLSKSETKCKASEKGYKNAVAKKAKRRIRDTQKYLKEFVTSDNDLNLSSFVMDQITFLCQRLMNIPISATSFKRQVEVCVTPIIDNSESDSESSKSGSRNATPIDHIYNEIDNVQAHQTHSSSKYPKSEHKVFSDGREVRRARKGRAYRLDGGTNHRLNSVVLFSSDSDSDERAQRLQRPTVSADSGHPSSRNQDYEQLLPQDPAQVFKNYTSESNSANNQRIMTPSTANVADYEIPVSAKQDTLFAPIATHPDRRTPSVSSSSQSKTNTLLSATAKRLLPATPKVRSGPDGGTFPSRKNSTQSTANPSNEGVDMTDSTSMANDVSFDNNPLATNTVELLAAAQTLLDGMKSSNDKADDESDSFIKQERTTPVVNTLPQDKVEHTTLIEPDYVDIEEIKFRESVRTARREILDRLKNRCPHHEKHSLLNDKPTIESNVSSSDGSAYGIYEPLNATMDHKNQQNVDSFKQTHSSPVIENGVSHSRDAGSFPLRQDLKSKDPTVDDKAPFGDAHGLYRSRLIHTYESKSPIPSKDKIMGGKPSDNDLNNSVVGAAIQKFESVATTPETRRTPNKRPKPVTKYAITPKHRSTSEPRTNSRGFSETTPGMANSNGHRSRQSYQNNALLPRQRTSSYDADSNGFDNSSRSLSKSSTESDLLKLLENESPSFIRKQWSKRRSISMTPKIQTPEVKPNARGPVYEKYTSFTIPNHSTRCHISSIVVLQNDNLVLLDETHGYLHLYDQHWKHKDSYRLMDTPKGCVKIDDSTVAVSFPYKKSISTYSVTMGAILSDRDISVPCSAWIVDIAYSRKMLYVLCKEGDVHLLFNDGSESGKICLGMSGKLFVPNNGNRLFIMGENKISKFDSEGVLLSSESEIDTRSMIAIENTIYVADRRNHKIVPLANNGDVSRLSPDKLVYPLAMCNSINGKYLFVSQFEESMDILVTRTIQVLRLKST